MSTSKPFSFILHIFSKNEYIADITIIGIAYRTTEPGSKVEQLSYSITQIVLDSLDITNIASYLDIQQINNACFNFAQTLFSEEINACSALLNFSLPGNGFSPSIAN